MNKIQAFLRNFSVPLVIVISLVIYSALHFIFDEKFWSVKILMVAIGIGSWGLVTDTIKSLLKKSFALDYIAILAIIVGVITQNYVVAAVITLMMTGGNALERFAQLKAQKSLTALKNRIPNKAQVVLSQGKTQLVAIEKIQVGSTIMIRKGEVVPLDGILESDTSLFDESSLTGEPYPVLKHANDVIRSGTLNVGQAVQLTTTVISKDSTYNRIVELVKEAESAQTPFIRLADTLSFVFTAVTLLLAGTAYVLSGDLERVLAVLVIATPCPLILATPIALIGGMSAAAQQRIIFKRLAILEVLSKVNSIVFDKTGTITIGKPIIESITVIKKKITEKKVLALASGLEKNSLHPYAKAIMSHAENLDIDALAFKNVHEVIGKGIAGELGSSKYLLSSDKKHPDSQVVLSENSQPIAVFTFKDELKPSSIESIQKLMHMGIQISIFTGDTAARGQELLEKLPKGIMLEAQLSPEQKRQKLGLIKKQGKTVAMVGDGINDAPALAFSDVGIAFSHQEHTAASEAADVVLLGRDFSGVFDSIRISHRTMQIAKQSMYYGVGLSMLGMVFAVGGYIPPLYGALTQEVIDVIVILNALRAVKA